MLKLLLKKQLMEIFRAYYYDAKKNKARSKAATIAYIAMFAVLMVVVLGGIFTLLSVKRCAPMAQAGMGWLYFALMGLLAVFLGVFGSVFNTYASLYLAKDNDLLLSMPIPVSVLLASRLLGVYLMGLLYSGIVILPAVIVYWAVAGATLANVLGGVLLTALISVFVMTLSCALGWVVAKISLKLKHKSFVTVVISLAFFGAYYFFYFRAHGADSGAACQSGGLRRRRQEWRLPHLSVWQRRHGRCQSVYHCDRVCRGAVRPHVGADLPQLPENRDCHGKDRPDGVPGNHCAAKEHSRGAAWPGIRPFRRKSQLYAQLRPGYVPDAGLRTADPMEGRRIPLHGGGTV